MKWTEEKIEYGIQLAKSMHISEAYEIFNKKYPINESAFRKKIYKELRYLDYVNGSPKKTRRDAWSKEEIDYLFELIKTGTYKTTREEFKKRYDRSDSAIITKMKDLKLKSNPEALEKQQKECTEGTKRTQFKKGLIPSNLCEVGTIKRRKNKSHGVDYYYWIKVTETGQPRYDWKLAQRYFYEKYHDCEIPKGYKVVFADGDTSNFAKENLILVTNQEFGYAFKYLGDSLEKAEAGIMIAKIKAAMKNLEKARNE